MALGDVELGQLDAAEIQLEVAHVGDPAGVLDRGGAVALEAVPHIVGGRDMVGLVHLIVLRAQLLERHVEAHGHNVLVGLDILGADEVGVVGGDQRDAQLLADADQLVVDLLQLGGVAVQLELQEVVLGAEQVAVPGGHLAGLLLLLHGQVLDNLAGDAGRGHDDALAVLGQQLAVDARAGEDAAVGQAVQMRARGQLDQIAVADLVLGQQQQVVVVLAALGHRVFDRAGRHIGFDADDRLDVGFFGGGVELHRAVHHAVIGQGDAVHPQLGRPLGDALGGGIAIQQAVFRSGRGDE